MSTTEAGYEVLTQLPVALQEAAGAYAAWQRAKEREEASRAMFREAVLAARDQDLRLDEIAAALGVTRQAVQKVLRTATREVAEQEAYAARYEPEAARRSLGRTGGYDRPQCGGCKRFLKARGAQCSSCGYMDGGGYLAVPASTTHLERWR